MVEREEEVVMNGVLSSVVINANTIYAVLYACLGVLIVVLCTMIGFVAMRLRAEKRNLARYSYVREEVKKAVPAVQKAKSEYVNHVHKHRHGAENKRKRAQRQQKQAQNGNIDTRK